MRLIVGPLLALHLLQVSVLCLTANELEAVERTGFKTDLQQQYHIQTDEGPERYFRFQTLNGQYRKEKRLEDGTVIGTEGWLDPLGYLRIKDYIADAKGFRILKSKTIFVGKEQPIHDVVEISRKVTNRPSRPVNPYRQPELRDLTSNSIEGSSSVAYASSTVPPLSSPVRYTPIAVTTFRPRPFALPARSANELTPSSQNFVRKSYPPKPALLVEAPPPPSSQQEHDDQNHLASSQDPATVRTLAPSRTFRGNMLYNGRTRNSSTTSNISDSIIRNNDSNVSNVSPISRQPSRRTSTILRNRSSAASSTIWQPTTTYPTSSEESNDIRIREGARARVTRVNYVLPKQYHEETQSRGRSGDSGKTQGSFGYIDPFGIRRVVYYKADGRNGFVHRKNNRYVGHNAKPYDPPAVAERHALH